MGFDWLQAVTTGLAVYAAGISTYRLLVERRDKLPHLHVRMSPYATKTNGQVKGVAAIEARNPGNVTVVICEIGFMLPNKQRIIPIKVPDAPRPGLAVAVALPHPLTPSDRITIPMDLDGLSPRLKLYNVPEIVKLYPYCEDAIGRIHRGRPTYLNTGTGSFLSERNMAKLRELRRFHRMPT